MIYCPASYADKGKEKELGKENMNVSPFRFGDTPFYLSGDIPPTPPFPRQAIVVLIGQSRSGRFPSPLLACASSEVHGLPLCVGPEKKSAVGQQGVQLSIHRYQGLDILDNQIDQFNITDKSRT